MSCWSRQPSCLQIGASLEGACSHCWPTWQRAGPRRMAALLLPASCTKRGSRHMLAGQGNFESIELHVWHSTAAICRGLE